MRILAPRPMKTAPVRACSLMPKGFRTARSLSSLSGSPVDSSIRVVEETSTMRALNRSARLTTSCRVLEVTPTLTSSISYASCSLSAVTSATLTAPMSLRNCLATWSRAVLDPSTTMVIRVTPGSSDAPAVKLSTL